VPTSTPNSTLARWQQGQLLEIIITDLSDRGDGIGRWQERVVFVPATVPGDRVRVRLMHVKAQYAYGKLVDVLEPSPDRVRPACIVADKCGGCQWQQVSYAQQLVAKRHLVVQALERLGRFHQPQVEPVLSVGDGFHYRNKATYPIGVAQRQHPDLTAAFTPQPQDRVIAGYYQKGSHRIVNLNQCPIQDQRLDPLLAGVKRDIQTQGWSIYDETNHRGSIRHLVLRIGRRTGEILLTIVSQDRHLPNLEQQAQTWMQNFSLSGVCLNLNPDKTNAIFGTETVGVVGQTILTEHFAGLTFQIRSDTFFQVFTESAEALLYAIANTLQLQGHETLLDAYCGIGTLTLPLAQQVRQAIGIEVQASAIEQAQLNATINQIANVSWQIGTVEAVLPTLTVQPDVVLLDPPRKGCDAAVLDGLLALAPARIVYVSCKPSTLARDLQYLCASGAYRLLKAQPADFFPQTAHVETAAFLERA
jgi:23S rRNA (uracil1939-C5)-methyltransferase